MNERITLLALKASDPKTGWLDRQKFAELIVRECLEQIDKIRDGCDEDGEHQQALGADWAGLAVARHFGVEE
jgi:hypothetical protein